MSSAVVAAGVLPAQAATDPGDQRDQVRRQIAQAQDDLDELGAKAATALTALRATQAQIADAQAALATANAKVTAAKHRKVDLDAQLVTARAEEAAGQAALDRNRRQTAAAQVKSDNLARSAYQGDGSERFALMLGAGTAQDLTERLYLVSSVADRQRGVVQDLAEERAKEAAEQVKLADATRRVAQLTLQARAAVEEAVASQAEADALTSRLTGLAATQRAELASVTAQKAEEQQRVDTLQAESDRITALLKARAAAEAKRAAAQRAAAAKRAAAAAAARGHSKGSSATSKATTKRSAPSVPRYSGGNGVLAYPVSAPVTSEFGMRYHPILHYARLHAGMDFGAPCGTPVHAAGNGTIVSAGWGGGYGNRIVIAHSGSLATTYNHLTSIVRRSGSVSRGELIGYSGTTGLSTGCHLHFETRVNGTPVNPRNYL